MKAFISQVARNTPFDNTDTDFSSEDVQHAIIETKLFASAARYAVSCGYNANAGVGRYLEWFAGVASNDAPFIVPKPSILREISVSTGVATTVEIGIYHYDVLKQSITLTNAKNATLSGIGASLLLGCEISVKVVSGSISKPVLFLFIQTE